MKVIILALFVVCATAAPYGYSTPQVRFDSYSAPLEIRAVPAYGSYAEVKTVKPFIPILRHTMTDDAYGTFSLETQTGNGISTHEEGHLKQGMEGPVVAKSGTISYTSPEGIPITLSYTADENGFRPQGSHLPVAPDMTPEVKAATREHHSAFLSTPTYSSAPSYSTPAIRVFDSSPSYAVHHDSFSPISVRINGY